MTFDLGHGYGSLALPDELFGKHTPSRRNFIMRIVDAVMKTDEDDSEGLTPLVTWQISVCIIDDCIIVDSYTGYIKLVRSILDVLIYIKNRHEETASYRD